jgi:molybdopterin/thiamine biosynthesis adenylyltransferase
MKDIASLLASSNQLKQLYAPVTLRIADPLDKQTLEKLIQQGDVLFIHDEIYGQLQELIKSDRPSVKIAEEEYAELVTKHLAGKNINEYGVWVYYPWAKRMVHLLDEDEFVEVRTNRNRNKITREEQQVLKSKKVGVVGLSVGQSIALTMAMERVCGELRLADFDAAELSNLNRIRTGTHNLGLNKTVIAAREIAEIDPFIKVTIFDDGLNQQNMDDFFTANGKLDLFIEVCDGLDIKLDSRFKAKQLQVPVVMDTNDRGMLDVERFDLEKDRSILHGMLDAFIKDDAIVITDENRRAILMSIVSFDSLSERMKLSMAEIGKSINTWPQLASSVVLGGAITTDIARKILLGEHQQSGRYYVDLDAIFKD